MPIGLATISSYFAEIGIQHKVIDCFGSEPTKPTHGPHFWSFGINPSDLMRKLTDCETVVIYANQASNHESVIQS